MTRPDVIEEIGSSDGIRLMEEHVEELFQVHSVNFSTVIENFISFWHRASALKIKAYITGLVYTKLSFFSLCTPNSAKQYPYLSF